MVKFPFTLVALQHIRSNSFVGISTKLQIVEAPISQCFFAFMFF